MIECIGVAVVDDTYHFDGWTPITLAIHLRTDSDWHGMAVHEPHTHKLARYPLDELEKLHGLMHQSKLCELEPRTDGKYEYAQSLLNSLQVKG